MSYAMLPYGIFSSQKSELGENLTGLALEDVGIFKAILSILRPNGIFSGHLGHLVHFVAFWYFVPVLVCCTGKNLAILVLCIT
jgi:hypothetical protein